MLSFFKFYPIYPQDSYRMTKREVSIGVQPKSTSNGVDGFLGHVYYKYWNPKGVPHIRNVKLFLL